MGFDVFLRFAAMKTVNAFIFGLAATMAVAEWTPSQELRGTSVPMPDERQLQFLAEELNQFSHWGINTMINTNSEYLKEVGAITWHDCKTVTNTSAGNQDAPCMGRDTWNPFALDTDQWMEASTAMGMKTILVTAQHEGGWCLWDTNTTDYSATNSPWGKSTGRNPLLEFVKSAHKWGMRVGYYFNIQCAHYEVDVKGATPEGFITTQLNKLRELLTPPYVPSRLWFDGTTGVPKGTNITELWDRAIPLIRGLSPNTLVGPYKAGDICYRPLTSVYGSSNGPKPNSSDAGACNKNGDPTGTDFSALESHGVTMQQGPDGHSSSLPTFWFWHDTVGFGDAARLFGAYLGTVGHGKTLNLNIAADATGRYNESMIETMKTFGDARNRTFGGSLAKATSMSGYCDKAHDGDFELTVPQGTTLGDLDYVSIKEGLSTGGQRISNYTVEYRAEGSSTWSTLVPAPTCYPWQDKKCVNAPNCNIKSTAAPAEGWHAIADRAVENVLAGKPEDSSGLGDAPSADYPRDAFIGYRRFDCPKAAGGVPLEPSTAVAAVRFVCLDTVLQGQPVHLDEFSLHKHQASFPPPWEQ